MDVKGYFATVLYGKAAGASHAPRTVPVPYREKPAKAAAKADAGVPEKRKRARADPITNAIGITAAQTGDLEFTDFSKEDRTMIIDAMNSMKETRDEAIPGAVKNKKKPASKR